MIVALERQKFVDRIDGGWVGSPEPHLPAARNGVRRVTDAGLSGRHDRCPRDGPIMHEPGYRKVSAGKCLRDQSHMAPDLRDTGRIGRRALKSDASAIGKGFKSVGGAVLVHTHRHMAPRLKP
jgi:hypothetical protein